MNTSNVTISRAFDGVQTVNSSFSRWIHRLPCFTAVIRKRSLNFQEIWIDVCKLMETISNSFSVSWIMDFVVFQCLCTCGQFQLVAVKAMEDIYTFSRRKYEAAQFPEPSLLKTTENLAKTVLAILRLTILGSFILIKSLVFLFLPTPCKSIQDQVALVI